MSYNLDPNKLPDMPDFPPRDEWRFEAYDQLQRERQLYRLGYDSQTANSPVGPINQTLSS